MTNPINYETVETLARWYNTLNSWEWPQDMPGKPEDFDNFEVEVPDNLWYIKYRKCIMMMNNISGIIGKRECLRWAHIHKLGKDENEFNDWWNKYGKHL